MTRELVYGRRAVREALRGRRQVLELWATERALASEPWLAGTRAHERKDGALSEAAGTRDHQGVLAFCEPYRYADAYELAAGEAPPEIVKLAEARQRAREARDFGEADRLRDEIAEAGWEVRDVSGGFELIPRA